LHLSDEQFEHFWQLSPIVICLRSAKTFKIAGGPAIHLPPTIYRRRADSLTNVVAHEVAHVILDHHDLYTGSLVEIEAAADDLAAQWGFKRSYSPKDLREMRELENTLPRPRSKTLTLEVGGMTEDDILGALNSPPQGGKV
jgi:hypothetical protein